VSFPTSIIVGAEPRLRPEALAIAAFTFLLAKKFERKARHGRLNARGTPKKTYKKYFFCL